MKNMENGYRVIDSEPHQTEEERTREAVEQAWPAMEKVGLHEAASIANLSFEQNIEKAVQDADFIKENVTEREELKRKVIAAIDQHAPKEAIIAYSTTGILPNTMQAT